MSLEVAMYEYDPAWKDQFRAESRELRKVFGRNAQDIQHVGSTAVKGMPSRQEIDILISVKDREAADRCAEQLGALGYVRAETEIPHCSHFERTEREPHASLYIFGRDGEKEAGQMLDIRDYLAVQPDVMKVFSDLKWQLAAGYGNSGESYAAAKKEFWAGIAPEAEKLSKAQGKMSHSLSIGMLFGAAIGMGFGQSVGNMSMGLVIGMAVGLCIGAIFGQGKEQKND